MLWVRALCHAGRLEDALIATTEIQGSLEKATALADVAEAFARKGQHERAKNTVGQAVNLLKAYESYYKTRFAPGQPLGDQLGAIVGWRVYAVRRFETWAMLADALVIAGDTTEAQKLARQVATEVIIPVTKEDMLVSYNKGKAEAANSIPFTYWPSQPQYPIICASLADVFVSAGLKEQANNAASAGLYVADGLLPETSFSTDIDEDRNIAKGKLTELFMKIGNPQLAGIVAKSSLAAAVSLGDQARYSAVVRALVATNSSQLMCDSAGEVFASTERAPDPARKSSDLVELAATLREARCIGKSDEATHLALATAEQVSESDSRALALAHVAESLAIEGHNADAWRTLEEALSLANRVIGYDDQSKFYLDVSRTYSALRRFRKARLAANLCPRAEYRLAAYTSLLTEFTDSKKPAA